MMPICPGCPVTGPIRESEHGMMQQHQKRQRIDNNARCPDCGGALRYGSYDPCEGYYYWCRVCGCGPILYENKL